MVSEDEWLLHYELSDTEKKQRIVGIWIMILVSGILIFIDILIGSLTIYYDTVSDFFNVFETCGSGTGLLEINKLIISLDFLPVIVGLIVSLMAYYNGLISKIEHYGIDSDAIVVIFSPLLFNLGIAPLTLSFYINLIRNDNDPCRLFLLDNPMPETMIMTNMFKSVLIISWFTFLCGCSGIGSKKILL